MLCQLRETSQAMPFLRWNPEPVPSRSEELRGSDKEIALFPSHFWWKAYGLSGNFIFQVENREVCFLTGLDSVMPSASVSNICENGQ